MSVTWKGVYLVYRLIRNAQGDKRREVTCIRWVEINVEKVHLHVFWLFQVIAHAHPTLAGLHL